MLLAIDCGNTQTVFGLFEGAELKEQFRVATDGNHTGDELAVMLRAFVELESLEGIVLCSSVPQLVREYQAFADRWVGTELLVLGPGVSTGVPIRYDDPREVGADRIANAVAARERHGVPAIVVDFGTSTNFDVVGARGEFLGGALAPGIEISVDALAQRAAQLLKVQLTRPRSVIGKNTVEALQSGTVFGFAGQVDGITRMIIEELGGEVKAVVATGGLAPLVVSESREITHHEPDLTLIGLRLVFEKNAALPR
jgi:type III pantothenate kinase